MRMRVPFHPQPSANTCVAACTKMLLAYHGNRVPMRAVSKGVKTERGVGAHYEDAGVFLLRQGYTPILFANNIIHSKDHTLSFARMLRRLQAILDDETCRHVRALTRSLNTFVSKGGIFRPRRLSQWELIQILKERTPVLVTMRVRAETRRGWYYHAIIVTGYSRKYIYYLDPGAGPTKVRRCTFANERRHSDGDALYIPTRPRP